LCCKYLVYLLILFLTGTSLSCSQKVSVRVLVAEDQSSHLKEIHQSLMQGRTIGLVNLEKNRSAFRINLDTAIDTMNLPEKTANAFRDRRKSTDLYLGVPSVECAQVAKYISGTYQIPFITNGYDDTLVENVDSVCVFNQNPSHVGKLVARYFYFYLKKNKVSLLYDEGILSNKQMAEGFIQEAGLIGLHISRNHYNGKSPKTDFNRILVTMKTWDPDIVFLCLDPVQYDSALTTMKQVFSTSPMVFLSRAPREDSLMKNPGLYEALYCISVFFEQRPTFVQNEFYKQFQKEFNRSPDFYAAMGYDEIMLIAELIQRKENQKKGDWFTECKGWKTENRDRYNTGFIGFDLDGLAQKPIDVLSIRNGKLVFQNEYWAEISLRR